MWRKVLISLAACAAVLTGGAITFASAGSDPVPHCQPVLFQENSGNGPNYHISVCGNELAKPASGELAFIVDGSPLQNKAVVFIEHVPSPSPSPSISATVSPGPTASPTAPRALSSGNHIAACWGHNGVQYPNHIAYECVSQPSGLGGALYWSANEANFNWDKHPGSGLDWVEASTLHVTTDSNPPNNKQAFWVGIAHQGTFCTVINPGYDQHPTQCEENGAVHPMTAKQLASYNQFAAAMVATGVPDCAWSMTVQPDQAQCDIDS